MTTEVVAVTETKQPGALEKGWESSKKWLSENWQTLVAIAGGALLADVANLANITDEIDGSDALFDKPVFDFVGSDGDFSLIPDVNVPWNTPGKNELSDVNGDGIYDENGQIIDLNNDGAWDNNTNYYADYNNDGEVDWGTNQGKSIADLAVANSVDSYGMINENVADAELYAAPVAP